MSAYLTPAEIRDLAIIAARARFDRADLAPMRFEQRSDDGSISVERVIPWLEALNLEVGPQS